MRSTLKVVNLRLMFSRGR